VCRLRDVAEAACESLGSVAEAQGVVLRLEVPESIELSLERARVERVFINLIGNALEVMPDGGTISDPRHQRERERPHRGGRHRAGLSRQRSVNICSSHLSAPANATAWVWGSRFPGRPSSIMGGDMWVESEAGHGARFIFRLPLRKPCHGRRARGGLFGGTSA